MNGKEDDDIDKRMAMLELKFSKLSDDFTQLRHEVNNLEEKLNRRT